MLNSLCFSCPCGPCNNRVRDQSRGNEQCEIHANNGSSVLGNYAFIPQKTENSEKYMGLDNDSDDEALIKYRNTYN